MVEVNVVLRRVKSCLLLALLAVPQTTWGASFSDLFVFGDSFSDSGNVFAATGGLLPPDPPYHQGRFSDGPIWAEHLARRLGLEIVANGGDPASIAGNNFAAGAARAGVDVPIPPLGTIPSVLTQVQTFISETGTLPPEALYVVFGGHNDVLLAADPNQQDGPQARQQIVVQAVEAVRDAAAQLSLAGARNILLPNLADRGLTPRALFI
jgi:phospholipase/lecithinase/hemolysin